MDWDNLKKIKELIDELIGENEPTDEELDYDEDAIAGIYCENENKMRKFLCDCLDLIDKDEVDKIKNSYKDLNGNK